MVLFIRRFFWFVLVVASGLAAALLGATHYGLTIDLNAWARLAGLQEVGMVRGIINRIPELLNLALIKSYGFYGSLAAFLVFLLIFTSSLRSSRNETTEAFDRGHAEDGISPAALAETVRAGDSFDHSPGDTKSSDSRESDFVAETNSDAVVGTDGQIYDGTATFSGTDTLSQIDARPDVDTGPDYDAEDISETELVAQEILAAADDAETKLSHLSDAELKSKTLDYADAMRSFEANYQDDRDDAASDLNEYSSDEDLRGDLQTVKDSYENMQKAFSAEFANEYRPEAVAIRHEIAKRLGLSEPYEESDPALDQGMLVGANPVTDAADLIEDLVKRLA